MKRRVHALFRWLLWLVGLAVTAGLGMIVFWLAVKQSPWQYVPDAAVSVSILREGTGRARLAGVIHANAGDILATLDEIRQHEEEFSGFFNQLNRNVLIAASASGQALIIADAGWKALFIRGGVLAARSVYNPTDNIHVSLSEHSTAGLDYNIYHIGVRGKRATVSIALIRNILLVAGSAESITAAVRVAKQDAPRKEIWTSLLASIPSGEFTFLTRTLQILTSLPCLIPDGPNAAGAAWSLEDKKSSLELSATIVFTKTTNEGRGAHRLLHSNQYRPTSPALIPSDTERLVSLLFDDLEEILGVLSPCNQSDTKQHSSLVNDWAANEFTVFMHRGKRYTHVRVVDPARALAARHAPGQSTRSLAKQAGWTLCRLSMPAFLEPLASQLMVGKRSEYLIYKGEHCIFGAEASALLTLVTGSDKNRSSLLDTLPLDAQAIARSPGNALLVETGGQLPFVPPLLSRAIHAGYTPGPLSCTSLVSADGHLRLVMRIEKLASKKPQTVQANMATKSNTTAPTK